MAYCEYIEDKNYDDGLQLVSRYPNLMITRSFSKIFGLGGLRIGWGYSNLENISRMYKYKKPFNVSRLACVAAIESLRSKSWLKINIKNNIQNKKFTIENLRNQKFEVFDTHANFIILSFKSSLLANRFVQYLNKHKVTVRLLKSYGLPNHVRMTIGTKLDMQKAVKISNQFNV